MGNPLVQRQTRRLSNTSSSRYEFQYASQLEKQKPPALFLLLVLLVPFVLLSMWATDTKVSVPKISLSQTAGEEPTHWNNTDAGETSTGGSMIEDGDKSSVQTTLPHSPLSESPGAKLSETDRLRADGQVEPDMQGGPIFVPSDVNNPTKVPMPPDGFPPANLPPTHQNAGLLQSIRRMSALTPRWPKHPGMHAIELRSYGPAYSSIIVSKKLKVIYVPVFKVGTTSMMYNIAYLENNPYIMNQELSKPGQRDFHLHEMGGPAWQNHTIYTKSTGEIRKVFEDPEYLKFGFVRNPYDRVISAYLDKVVQFGPETREYQKQMYGLYGDDFQMREFRNQTKPSFKEYLQGIEKVLKQPRSKSTNFWAKEAFEDNNGRRDLHWRPQVELLHPDLIHLDYVGRFEAMDVDRDVVLNWMYQHTDRRIPEHKLKKMHSTDPEHKIEIYNELKKDIELKELVLRIYQEDFSRFHISTNVPEPRRANS